MQGIKEEEMQYIHRIRYPLTDVVHPHTIAPPYRRETLFCPTLSKFLDEGLVIVQMLKPATVKNFDQYASQIFIPYILSQFQKASCIDLVWDRCIENTLKSAARAKRDKGVCRRVVSGTPIPSNWYDFLCVDSNKLIYFSFCLLLLLIHSI